MAKKKPFLSKHIRKKAAGCCQICGENNYKLLDTHRIIEGSENGRYTRMNICVLCVTCHRKHHTGEIQIMGWFYSTAGWLLNIIDENGEEDFIKEKF